MILVTGGAGFIGSHLVGRLVEQEEQIRVFDNFSSGSLENLEKYGDNVEVVGGDLRDEFAVTAAMTGVELVYHQGAVPSVPQSVADPRTSMNVGITGSLNVLLAARNASVRRVVFASSSSVYGDTPEMPKHEDMKPRPLSPYAISKLSAEQLCGVFFKLYGLETVSLRYFNVFGPNQDPASAYAAVIPKFIQALSNGETPTVFGDGEQTRDFTYVDNAVDANLRAATVPKAAGGVFNIASGRPISINQMLQLTAEGFGVKGNANYKEPRPGDIKDSYADIGKARSILGYDPLVSFEEGLARTIASCAHGLGTVSTSSI